MPPAIQSIDKVRVQRGDTPSSSGLIVRCKFKISGVVPIVEVTGLFIHFSFIHSLKKYVSAWSVFAVF